MPAPPFTAASERSMYAVTALLVSPLAAELPASGLGAIEVAGGAASTPDAQARPCPASA